MLQGFVFRGTFELVYFSLEQDFQQFRYFRSYDFTYCGEELGL
jgi:hypothetical protein